MRISKHAHTLRPWRIHGLTRDFRLEDVWALPTPGGPRDFPQLVDLITSMDPSRGSSQISRLLFAVRWRVGGLLGWDRPETGVGSRVATLRDRLPGDLRDAPAGQREEDQPFGVADVEREGLDIRMCIGDVRASVLTRRERPCAGFNVTGNVL